MSAVSEWIVREYFEGLGYLVNQPRKHTVPGRQKRAAEEIDLVVCNPLVHEQQLSGQMMWTRADLAGVARAIVAVRGWHTERFYPSTFEQTPDILRFVEDEALSFAEELLGSGPVAKVLCLPRLPASGDLKDQAMLLLREKGIDGVISFETMLTDLIARVDINRNYEKSDLLQTIRILKNYGLLKDSQLDLFEKRRKR
ncbi:MAG: hypothetical protein HN919_07775 [Verrucomicrobia bacterium]|jgi:hypothetical protein|nr:hypothetical protein [Verrucomicrobiota bacterium]MBT7066186.1 hypothetical protein [Verrucomicrobiota bacterium]MBT7698777.1 hypothetical protein [Verrucomicrobiota bacterium]